MTFGIFEKVMVDNCFFKNQICTIINRKYEVDSTITYVLVNDTTGETFEAEENTLSKVKERL